MANVNEVGTEGTVENREGVGLVVVGEYGAVVLEFRLLWHD